jgi:hypothetical protein
MADKSTSPFAGLDKALLRSTKQSSPPPPRKDVEQDTAKAPKADTTIPRYRGTVISLAEDDILDVARKAVRQIGKEAATHRFTIDEKNSLADIEYTYRRQGIRTSENEITRIAINYFIEDYRTHGDSSLLAQTLKRLNS